MDIVHILMGHVAQGTSGIGHEALINYLHTRQCLVPVPCSGTVTLAAAVVCEAMTSVTVADCVAGCCSWLVSPGH